VIPVWYVEWSARHASRFNLRSKANAQAVAEWFSHFANMAATPEELEATSVELMPSPPAKITDHLPALRRLIYAARAKAVTKTEQSKYDPAEWSKAKALLREHLASRKKVKT
jgi:hypothetical protein